MKIFLVSSEVVPFAKTGGLADVAGALPKALKDLGHDIRVILPRYKMVDIQKFGLKPVIQKMEVIVGSDIETANVYEAKIPGTEVIVYFVDNPNFFERDGLYQINGVDYADNCERFTFFCKAVLEFIKKINWKPDVLHANDWQSALTVGYLKTILKGSDFYGDIGTLYSIHNMAYQGNFDKQKIHVLGLPWTFFTYETLEFFGELSLTKAGFVFADIINTVSEGYAKEIQTKEFGCGMDGLLRYRSRDVYGVLNGIDYDVWDPATDKKIKKTYTPVRIVGKKECKRDLQNSCGLPKNENVPVLGLVTRLADQKGMDLFVAIMEDLMHRDLQIVILGTGDLKYHQMLTDEQKNYPDKLSVALKFDAILAQKIYAGCDMFLMPSHYEPCGLGQLISFKYGTIPIVRKTGGLADTVHEFSAKTGRGEGFVFEEYSSKEFLSAIKRALKTYAQMKTWKALQKKVMQLDYSWNASAKKYVELYKKALAKVRG